MNYKVLIAATLAATAVHANSISDQLPESWFKTGKTPALSACTAGIDRQLNYLGDSNITLLCESPTEGFITAMQQFSAEEFRGSRVRFSAQVKAEDVKGWSGLWMRIDATEKKAVAFDNMMDRPIKGTQGWSPYEVVLDVPADGERISFGVLIENQGQVWLKDTEFEAVPTNVATTGALQRTNPNNLNLQQR
ncbi:hypothetical protein Mag101_12930 [Microbulbifer agarilyticus]|uniref:Transcriptional regulator n=1 Tax=Microbulbifer agarilyticus TaxID=260552 RepID=A0A1Q2M6R3_9GAMM|nr:hypothetical protein [Microbulbifer agarilyticus]AQQ68435.1 hypothetical protein Mag101_12930 [Microbulbifer agarilyticus]